MIRNTKRVGTKSVGGKWSIKYKKSIKCSHPKGFSQKQHCKYGRRTLKNIFVKKYKNFLIEDSYRQDHISHIIK